MIYVCSYYSVEPRVEPVLGDEARGPGREAELRLECFRDPCEVNLRVLFKSTAGVYFGKIIFNRTFPSCTRRKRK